MKDVLYAKFNRTRKPEYQVSTCICEENGIKFVEKRPLTEAAWKFLQSFQNKYEAVNGNSERYTYLKPQILEDAVRFEFIEGNSISAWLDQSVRDYKTLKQKIEQAFEVMFAYREVKKFQITKEFTDVFGEIRLENQATLSKYINKWTSCVGATNVDIIFDNFIKSGDQWYCIDYEWVFEEPIPIEYVKYRTLLYYYGKNYPYLSRQISQSEFMMDFGYSQQECELFNSMEDGLQQSIHGVNRECIYTRNYMKQIKNFKDIVQIADEAGVIRQQLANSEEMLRRKDQEIIDRDQRIKELDAKTNQFRRMIKNPAYLAAFVAQKYARKFAMKLATPDMKKTYGIIKREGMDAYLYRKKKHDSGWDMYQQWIKQNDEAVRKENEKSFDYQPLISIVVPVYNVETSMLTACIESVRNQIYSNWELCLVDDASTMKSVAKTLAEYKDDPKIKIKYRKENGHISRCTNDGFAMATGEFVALLDCDDLLTENALYEMVAMLNQNPEYDFIYSDEDKIDEDGKERNNPFFKPDWSPDTFMSIMYTCHFSLFRKSVIDSIGGLRVGYEGSQDYDLVLRISEVTNRIGHIPKILYHWRTRKESTANDMAAKPYILESTIKAKEDAIARRGRKGRLEYLKNVCQYRVVYDVDGNPKVSIVIPSKDNYNVLKQCITTLKNHTNYRNIEIIVIDNGTKDADKIKYEQLCSKYDCRYFYNKEDFNFSHMCNVGAEKATGEYVLFLNDDIEIKQRDWLDRMLGQAQNSYTGAVGCKLLYPGTKLIQHTGVVNYEIGPGHCFHKFDDSLNCYFGRNVLDYNYMIVTGACLLVNADKFREVGGFEEKLPIAYNDVELCFKLVEHGYYNVVRNDVTLIHHESISRGYENTPEKATRLKREAMLLYELHPQFKNYDPCYNPNLAPDKGDFSFNVKLVKDVAKADRIHKTLEGLKDISQSSEYTIEDLSYDNEYVHLAGWVFNRLTRNNRKASITAVLTNEKNDIVEYHLNRKFRPDVSRAKGKRGNKSFTGFDFYIPILELEKNQYDLSFVIENEILHTNCKINL